MQGDGDMKHLLGVKQPLRARNAHDSRIPTLWSASPIPSRLVISLERILRMRTFLAALLVVSMAFIIASVAQATPTQVSVRIEGKSETLFEGPIWTEGHDVKASSDTQARPCDGTNNHAHATPGATPTTSAVDAMHIIGETFDAQWYGSSFDDYFLTRFGPDEQSVTEGAYWGILVNNVFTNVGGCQYELGPDNEVLWVYDAFKARPFLALLPVAGGYTSGLRPLMATAELGKPFAVEVINYADDNEDNPPSTPERTGSTPEPGARVSPVHTAANGFEKIETESSPTVVTDAQGKTSITFTKPGWHRIKATVVAPQGMEGAVRSNRLDVCVLPEGQSACEEPPAEDQVRTPPPSEEEATAETPPLPIGPIQVPSTESGSSASAPPGRPEALPSSPPPMLLRQPFTGVTPRKPSSIFSAKTAKRPVLEKSVRARCVRPHRRHTASHIRSPRKCKIARAPRIEPKHHPRPRRRGR
jgi:hypothetical protein